MSKRTRSYASKGQGRTKVTRTVVVRAARRRPRYSGLKYRRRNYRSSGFIAIETKFLDTTLVQNAITANANMTGAEQDPSAGCTGCLTAPATGDGEQQKDGKQLIAKYLEIALKCGFASGEAVVNPLNAQQVLIAVVLDKQTNGAQLNSEDVWKNLGNTANGSVHALRNLLFGKRFRILKQMLIDLTPETLAASALNDFSWQGKERCYRWFIPLNNMKINFTAGTTADVANVLDNSVHIIAQTNNLAAAPYLSYNARFRFQG